MKHLTLSVADRDLAEYIAHRRHRMQRRRLRPDPRIDRTRQGLMVDIEGAIGELAFALMSGLTWDHAFHPTTGEWQASRGVGRVSGVEVKTTRYNPPWLKLRPHHDPDSLYVSMRVAGDNAWCYGWIWGYEGQEQRFWRADMPVPCWCVPPSALRHNMKGLL